MGRIFSVNFWIQTFVLTLMTMIMIYVIKQIAAKVNVPIISDVAAAV